MKRKGFGLVTRREMKGYLFLLPWLIGFLLFFAVPLVQSFIYSLSSVKMTAAVSARTPAASAADAAADAEKTRTTPGQTGRKQIPPPAAVTAAAVTAARVRTPAGVRTARDARTAGAAGTAREMKTDSQANAAGRELPLPVKNALRALRADRGSASSAAAVLLTGIPAVQEAGIRQARLPMINDRTGPGLPGRESGYHGWKTLYLRDTYRKSR